MIGKLALALTLCAACGGDTVQVPVELAIDQVSCTTSDPQALAIDCDASVGVWVRDQASSALLHSACVELDGPTTMGSLPQALAGVDLSGIRAETIRVELAVFSPATTSECPEPGTPSMIAYADATADLANRTPLTLQMQCELAGDDAQCESACEENRQVCTMGDDSGDGGGDDWFEHCVNQWEECSVDCPDGGCDDCSEVFFQCYQVEDTGDCEFSLDNCLQECAGEACYVCFDQYRSCRAAACTDEYDDCLSGCANGDDECLRITN